MIRSLVFAAAVLLGSSAIAAPAKVPPKLTDLQEIQLPAAVNPIEKFTADGRPATIIRAYRSNAPSPHGYTLYMVVIGDDLVNFDAIEEPKKKQPDNATRDDTVRDWPHTDNDKLWTVRFAHGKLDGQPATLLITARRESGESYPTPTRTRIAIHRLVHHEDDNFSSPEVFEPAIRLRTAQVYGHADVALLCELGLPLPADTGAEDTACPAKGKR